MRNLFRILRRGAIYSLAVAILAVAAPGLIEPSAAKETKTIAEGGNACKDWCRKHNKTFDSLMKCQNACDLYWWCNGSDATDATCKAQKEAQKATSVAPQLPPGMEDNTDRPGADFGHFAVTRASECQAACRKDTRCKSWTYVRPRVQGASAVCYLKNGIPPASFNRCCVSGVVPRSPVGVDPRLPPPASQN